MIKQAAKDIEVKIKETNKVKTTTKKETKQNKNNREKAVKLKAGSLK